LFRARLAAKAKGKRFLRKQQIMLLPIKSTLVDRKINVLGFSAASLLVYSGTATEGPLRVKRRKPHSEQMFSGLPPIADLRPRGRRPQDFASLGEMRSESRQAAGS
jgi:hypothetical protein